MTETHNEHPWRDRETLVELYHERGLSQSEVADELGTYPGTICRWMDKLNVSIKDARGRGDLTASDTPCPFYTISNWSDSKNRKRSNYEFWQDTKNKKRVRVHRLLAVSEFGFDAVVEMDVHHKNGITWDNRPDNIELMTRQDHLEHHAQQRAEVADD